MLNRVRQCAKRYYREFAHVLIHFTTVCNRKVAAAVVCLGAMEWLSKAGDLLDKVRERPEEGETRGCDVD